MFITREAYKSPALAVFADSGEFIWTATELALQQSWFLVSLEGKPVDAAGLSFTSTLLVSNFKSVESLLHSGPNGNVHLKSAHVVTPGHVNRSNDWQMERLRAIWVANEMVEGDAVPTDIYETVSGNMYKEFFCNIAVEDLVGRTLKYRFEP
jgi:hypothetical protein